MSCGGEFYALVVTEQSLPGACCCARAMINCGFLIWDEHIELNEALDNLRDEIYGMRLHMTEHR